MSVQRDAQVGLRASLHASRDEIVAACLRAAEVLGGHASASASPAKVIVQIFPGFVKSLSKVSPLVGITLQPGTDDVVLLAAKIEQYKTLQSRAFFIPIGPQQLVGKGTYLNFLKALEAELRAIDAGNGTVERTGA
jgi:hypothetical protein